MDLHVLATHPAAEQSVTAYFDFAHALSVLGQVRDIGEEMCALIEVMTGAPPDEEAEPVNASETLLGIRAWLTLRGDL